METQQDQRGLFRGGQISRHLLARSDVAVLLDRRCVHRGHVHERIRLRRFGSLVRRHTGHRHIHFRHDLLQADKAPRGEAARYHISGAHFEQIRQPRRSRCHRVLFSGQYWLSLKPARRDGQHAQHDNRLGDLDLLYNQHCHHDSIFRYRRPLGDNLHHLGAVHTHNHWHGDSRSSALRARHRRLQRGGNAACGMV